MYRFLLRPRWIGFHLLVVGGIVLMISLGFWQLRRWDQRKEFNAQVTSRIDLAAVPLDELVAAGADPDAVEWRAVEARGTYLPDEQVVVVNRSQGGRAGDMIVTPLELADGRILLVERGFVPLGAAAGPPPDGDVAVLGRLRPSQERRRGGLSDPATGDLTEVQRLDIERLTSQLPGPVVPMYVELVDAVPAPTDGDPEPVAAPELDEGPHLSYAVQWFIFATCVAGGWVLAVRRSIATRRVTTADSPPAVAEVATADAGTASSSSG
jgi:cytochrome oxidase assembly protein ShyY1